PNGGTGNGDTTSVYGNVLVKFSDACGTNNRIIHFGGDQHDSTCVNYRSNLHLYNNTIVTKRNCSGNTFLVLSCMSASPPENVDARNNIIMASASGLGGGFLLRSYGTAPASKVVFTNNWIRSGTADTCCGDPGVTRVNSANSTQI